MWAFSMSLMGSGWNAAVAAPDAAGAPLLVVLEPAANVELNMTSYFRVNFGAGYRWVTGVDSPGFSSGDFSALEGVLTFKFGSF